MTGYLLDTNVISELRRPEPNPRVRAWVRDTPNDLLFVSVLTLGEIWEGITRLSNDTRAAKLAQWLHVTLLTYFGERILDVTREIAERWGVLAGKLERSGRSLPVVDGLLAATALHHDLTFATRNVVDVLATGVPVTNPWE
jgi:predicted nucleic acid-binding protein